MTVLHFTAKISKMGDKLLVIIPKHLHDKAKQLSEFVEVIITRYGEGPKPPPTLKTEGDDVVCYYPLTKEEKLGEEEPLVLKVCKKDEIEWVDKSVSKTLTRVLLDASMALERGDAEKARKLLLIALRIANLCIVY